MRGGTFAVIGLGLKFMVCIIEDIDAFMTLAFVSLPVIPKLRLNTYGVIDTEQQQIVDAVYSI